MDTSALLKAFVLESGSQNMIALLEQTDDPSLIASELTPIELRSAIRRRFRIGDISESSAEIAVHLAKEEASRMKLLPLSSAIMDLCSDLIDRQNLRTLDAIQLATALVVKGTLRMPDSLLFVASDKNLLVAADAEGIPTWNPMSGPLP